MQFLQCGQWNGTSPDLSVQTVLEACTEKFDGREGVDFFISLQTEKAGWDFVENLAAQMKLQQNGALVLVVSESNDKEMVRYILRLLPPHPMTDGLNENVITKRAFCKHIPDNIRFNTVTTGKWISLLVSLRC